MKIETAKKHHEFWQENFYRMSGAAFWEKFGLKDYPYTPDNIEFPWNSSIELATEALKKAIDFLEFLPEDSKRGHEYYKLIVDIQKFLSKAKTKWFLAQGHSWRMLEVKLQGNWVIAHDPYVKWSYIAGKITAIDFNTPPFRGTEEFTFYDTEEDLIRDLLPNVIQITNHSVVVQIDNEKKGQFIGTGGNKIKMNQILIRRHIKII